MKLERRDWIKSRTCGVLSELLKKPGNDTIRHTGRDEVEIRYPLHHCFFWIPDSRFAPSGMTD